MVLEARYKAEKIGYPVIGERAKESSDVIDYNIQEEITKDASSVVNANNDTTTGMATVIPGVNAPKLIAKTSIIGIDFNAGYVGGVKLRMRTAEVNNVPGYENVSVYINSVFSESDQRGPYDFKFVAGRGVVMPAQGTYKFECTFYPLGGWSSGFEAKYQVMFKGNAIGTTGTSDDNEYLTVTVDAKKGDGVNFLARLYNSSPNVAEVYPSVDVTITKL